MQQDIIASYRYCAANQIYLIDGFRDIIVSQTDHSTILQYGASQ